MSRDSGRLSLHLQGPVVVNRPTRPSAPSLVGLSRYFRPSSRSVWPTPRSLPDIPTVDLEMGVPDHFIVSMRNCPALAILQSGDFFFLTKTLVNERDESMENTFMQ